MQRFNSYGFCPAWNGYFLNLHNSKNQQIFLSFSVSLFVEWEEFDVDAAVGLIDGGRVPGHSAVVMQDSLEKLQLSMLPSPGEIFRPLRRENTIVIERNIMQAFTT